MKKVFIINKGSHDYSKAEKFGEIIYLTKGKYNQVSTGRMMRDFTAILRHSQEGDYILSTGLTIMNIIACSVFVHKHGRLNLLIYHQGNSGKEGKYKQRIILFEEDS